MYSTFEQRFAYVHRPLLLAACAVFSAAGGAMLFHAARVGEEVQLFPLPVLVSGGPVHLIAAALAALAIFFAYALVRPVLFGPAVLVVTPNWIEMPISPIRGTLVRVHQEDVRNVTRLTTGRRRIVQLEAATRTIEISSQFVGDAGVAAVEHWLALGSPLDDYPSVA